MKPEEINKRITELLGGCWHGGSCNCADCKDLDNHSYIWNKNYTENIADTWELVEFLKDKNLYLLINTVNNSIEVYKNGGTQPNPIVRITQCDSIEVAICLAFIKAQESEEVRN